MRSISILRSLSVILLMGLLALACSETSTHEAATSTGDAESDADARLNAYLDEVFEARVARSPIRQSRLGRDTDRLGEWDDVSDAFADEEHARMLADLDTLESTFDRDGLGSDANLSYDLFVRGTRNAIDAHAFRRQVYVVDQFNGQVSGLLSVLPNTHPIDDVGDAEDYISRIAGLESVLGTMAGQLQGRAEFGVLPPAFAFPAMLADARAMSGGAPISPGAADNALYADFKTKLEALETDDAGRADLLERAEAALTGPFQRGFASLIETLETLQPRAEANGDKGVWSLPDGEAFYQNRVRAHTTLDVTADEVHEIGLREVARLHNEMGTIKDSVGFDGDLQAFFEFIREDPNNYYANSDAGREAFLEEARTLVEEIRAVVGDYFNRMPKAELEVRRVEPWRENSVSIAFYNAPSEDGSRPGIYYANLADMASVQKYVFTAITYHESIPGHHFQIALARELEGLPKFRAFGGHTAFVEGWALYAEKLAKEMGFYADPYRDFGRLQNELWRSVRLVIDTGIHAKQWNREQSITYFRENTPLSEGDIVTEVERYFVNPGQALSYKMGMIEIEALRAEAEAALGENFDIRAFHDVVIGTGSLPLPVLREQVERYIEAKPEYP